MADENENIDVQIAHQVGEMSGRLTAVSEQVRALGDEFVAKQGVGEKVTADLKEAVDKALEEQGNLRADLDDIAQKMARRAQEPQNARAATPGEQFIADEKVKAFLAEGFRSRGRVRMDLQAVTTNTTLSGIVAPDRVNGLVALPERRMTVRDLITPGRTVSNTVQYWKETGFTNAATAVSEGQYKPESSIAGELVTGNVSTIAHILIASKQVLEDAAQLSSHIDGRLRYGLAYEEELELLLGDGGGTRLLGLVPQATAFTEHFQPEFMQRIDFVRLALLQSELALFPASGVVVNPIDWARIETTKDNQGRYIFAQVQEEGTPRLWGRPLVSTPAMTETKFLAGAFQLGAQIFDREDANVEISTEDGDNFKKNLVTIRGEERLALAVYRGEAFVYGTFQSTT